MKAGQEAGAGGLHFLEVLLYLAESNYCQLSRSPGCLLIGVRARRKKNGIMNKKKIPSFFFFFFLALRRLIFCLLLQILPGRNAEMMLASDSTYFLFSEPPMGPKKKIMKGFVFLRSLQLFHFSLGIQQRN